MCNSKLASTSLDWQTRSSLPRYPLTPVICTSEAEDGFYDGHGVWGDRFYFNCFVAMVTHNVNKNQ